MNCESGTIRASQIGVTSTFPALTNQPIREVEMAKAILSNQSLKAEKLAYKNARSRCQNPKHVSYPRYGQRGIEFRFTSFEQFFACLGPRPSDKHSLDRFPNSRGHYEPGNVRWATVEEQVSNKACNVKIAYQGETLTAAEWSRRLGSRNLVLNRMDMGWCSTCAVSIPPDGFHTKGCTHKGEKRNGQV